MTVFVGYYIIVPLVGRKMRNDMWIIPCHFSKLWVIEIDMASKFWRCAHIVQVQKGGQRWLERISSTKVHRP